MLSLSPRMDLFSFSFPKEFFAEEILEKYNKILNTVPGVLTNAIDYVNESIQGVSIPGINNIAIEQPQNSKNVNNISDKRINIEPSHPNYTYTSANPISLIEPTFTVTLRQNQGLLNYYMLYENVFYMICKPELFRDTPDLFKIYISDENGNHMAVIKLMQPILDGIDGLEFSFSKTERQTDTFNLEFKFNNIDFEFLYENVK